MHPCQGVEGPTVEKEDNWLSSSVSSHYPAWAYIWKQIRESVASAVVRVWPMHSPLGSSRSRAQSKQAAVKSREDRCGAEKSM